MHFLIFMAVSPDHALAYRLLVWVYTSFRHRLMHMGSHIEDIILQIQVQLEREP